MASNDDLKKHAQCMVDDPLYFVVDKPTLTDAQAMAKIHSATFDAPNKEELEEIKANYSVKIGHPGAGERFWVQVHKVKDGWVYGHVDNNLICVDWPLGYKVALLSLSPFSLSVLSLRSLSPFSLPFPPLSYGCFT